MAAQMLSVDLKKAALYELDFLEHVKSLKLLQDYQVLQVALHRYEKHWLPFLQSYSQVKLTNLIKAFTEHFLKLVIHSKQVLQVFESHKKV